MVKKYYKFISEGVYNIDYESDEKHLTDKKKGIILRKTPILQEIKRILINADVKKYIINNKLNDLFFKELTKPVKQEDGKIKLKSKGSFHYKKHKDEENENTGQIVQRSDVDIKMGDPFTEIYVGLMIIGSSLIPKKHKEIIPKLYDYVGISPIDLPIMLNYLDNLKYINVEREYVTEKKSNRGRKKIIATFIENPKTGNFINERLPTYKKIYKKIILKEVIIKDLASFNTVQYKVNDNCVKSYIEKEYGKELCKKYIPDNPTYPDIAKLAYDNKINFIVSDITNNNIYKQYNPENKKSLEIIIHNEHMYVIDNNITNYKKIQVLNKRRDIYDTSNKKLITDSSYSFNKIKEEIKKEYILHDYSNTSLTFKTNELIYYEDKKALDEIKEDLEDIGEGSRSKSIYSIIDSKLKLKGYMNQESYDIFNSIKAIRNYDTGYKCTVRLDANKSYVSELYNGIFGIPCLNDYPEIYVKGDDINPGSFYYCKLNSYDVILGKEDSFYCYDNVIQLKNDKRIIEITYKYEPNETSEIKKDIYEKYLPNKHNCKETIFSLEALRCYTGWLKKSSSLREKYYDNVKGEEAMALSIKYKDNCNYDNDNNKFTINHTIPTLKSGIMAYIQIIQKNNLKLYKLHNKIMNLNKDAILVTVKTDSLGYLFKNENYILPTEDIKKNYMGKFKIEKENKIYKKVNEGIDQGLNIINNDILFEQTCDEYIHKIQKPINNLSRKHIVDLVYDRSSFILDGRAGFGKTHLILTFILPLMKNFNIKYILASTTKEQAKDFKNKVGEEVYTVQDIFHSSRSFAQIKLLLNGAKYIIIDEAVQLKPDVLKYLEILKSKYNISYIALSDKYQCVTEYYKKKPYIDTRFSYELFDNNIVSLKKHKHMRYNKDLYKRLQRILDNFDSKEDVQTIVKDYFINTNEIKTKFNIAFTNARCNDVYKYFYIKKYNGTKEYYNEHKNECKKKMNKDGYYCVTTHSIQGKTINEPYTVHETYNMDSHIIYTALSRAKTTEQIYVCTLTSDFF